MSSNKISGLSERLDDLISNLPPDPPDVKRAKEELRKTFRNGLALKPATTAVLAAQSGGFDEDLISSFDETRELFQRGVESLTRLANARDRDEKENKPDGVQLLTYEDIANSIGEKKRYVTDRKSELGPPDHPKKGRRPHGWYSNNPRVEEFLSSHRLPR